MAKLWQKNYSIDALLEDFTVGIDYQLDLELVESDAWASMAHGKMLKEIGILTEKDFRGIQKELNQIISLAREGKFPISKSDEDGHTAIENHLTEKLGEPGKKIHTGRSRNDQVITAIRVHTRARINIILDHLTELISQLLVLAEKHQLTPMPGRTHMQIAMPSSVGLWAAAFAEELLDGAKLVENAQDLINQSSLGSAASYGVPLPLDRSLTAELLAFPKIQNNVLYVNNSRGKMESVVLDALDQVALTLSKMATDLIWFSLPEFGYFSLPAELCSGSSIMPQKKNPDGLELMRGKAATLSGYAQQVKNVIRSLPTGYNRDFQETKEPLLRGMNLADMMIQMMELTIRKLEVHPEQLEAGFLKEIYATDAALEKVASGMSFRDAYREVGTNLERLGEYNAKDSLRNRTSQGTTGNLRLDIPKENLSTLQGRVKARFTLWNKAWEKLSS